MLEVVDAIVACNQQVWLSKWLIPVNISYNTTINNKYQLVGFAITLAQLLRCQIRGRSQDHPFSCDIVHIQVAEIFWLCQSQPDSIVIIIEQNVGRSDVAMNDSGTMGGIESNANLIEIG